MVVVDGGWGVEQPRAFPHALIHRNAWKVNSANSPPRLEINVHVADAPHAPEFVGWFTCALALRRRDKGKPAARRGRKAHGALFSGREAARLPNGGGVTTERALKREPHPPT